MLIDNCSVTMYSMFPDKQKRFWMFSPETNDKCLTFDIYSDLNIIEDVHVLNHYMVSHNTAKILCQLKIYVNS